MTLVGERHRADITLPSRTPITQLLPDMHQLHSDRITSRTLVRQLPTSDGAALPLPVRSRSTPPALVVHNVADQVADGPALHTSHRCPVARREPRQGEPFASRAVRGLRRIVSSSAVLREVAGITRADAALGTQSLRRSAPRNVRRWAQALPRHVIQGRVVVVLTEQAPRA